MIFKHPGSQPELLELVKAGSPSLQGPVSWSLFRRGGRVADSAVDFYKQSYIGFPSDTDWRSSQTWTQRSLLNQKESWQKKQSNRLSPNYHYQLSFWSNIFQLPLLLAFCRPQLRRINCFLFQIAMRTKPNMESFIYHAKFGNWTWIKIINNRSTINI